MISNVVHNKYPKMVVYWNESTREKRLRNYAEFYQKKAEEYRKQYDKAINTRLQKELQL